MIKILQNTINITEFALQTICGLPGIEKHEEQYLITVNLAREDSESERVRKIYKLYEYCLEHGLSEALPAGFILTKSNLINRRYEKADYFFCLLNSKCHDERLYIKPKGNYAVIDHQGSYDNISCSYDQLIHFINENQLTIIGNAYVHELLGYIAVGNPDKYVIRIAIEVE